LEITGNEDSNHIQSPLQCLWIVVTALATVHIASSALYIYIYIKLLFV